MPHILKNLRAASITLASLTMLLLLLNVVTATPAHAASKINIANDPAGYIDVQIAQEKYSPSTGTYRDLITYNKGKAVKPKVTVTYKVFAKTDPDMRGTSTTVQEVKLGGKTYKKAIKEYLPGEPIASSRTLVSGRDYTLTFKNNKKVGLATVVVQGKGDFTGKVTKSFFIFPQTTKVTKVKSGNKSLTVYWKSLSQKQCDTYKVKVYTRGKKYKETVYYDASGNYIGTKLSKGQSYASKKTYTRYKYKLVKTKSVEPSGKGSVSSTTIKGLKKKTKYYVSVEPSYTRMYSRSQQKTFANDFLNAPLNKSDSLVRPDGTRKCKASVIMGGGVFFLSADSSPLKAGKTK